MILRLSFLAAFLLILLNFHSANADRLISYQLKSSFSKEDLAKAWKENSISQFIIPINYAVDLYELEYMTQWHDGTPIKASGLYFVPRSKDSNKSFPSLSYQHGTSTRVKRNLNLEGEIALCVGFATDGYLVAHPDYIGLGTGDKFHLYQHRESEAVACRDMLRAVRELNQKLKVKANEQLFLTGYSQGGHATMALNQLLQESDSTEFPVTAASPMSGAYDMSGAQIETMYRPYTNPFYLPYLMVGMQEVYGVVDGGVKDILKPEYKKAVDMLFDGKSTYNDVNSILPSIPKDMVLDSVVNIFENDPNFAFTKALAINDTYNWKPNTPMQLCYCRDDEEVSYKNSLVAYEAFKEKGSKNIRLRHGGKKLEHEKCAIFTSIFTKMYFDQFKKGKKKIKKGPAFKRFLLSLAKLKVRKM